MEEWNDNGAKDFDEYTDFSSSKYRNFDEIDEFHNNYREFPMDDCEDRKPISTDAPDFVQEEVTKHHLEISAAQVLATTLVALVVVTAILIPALDNKDTEAYIGASITGGVLNYYASVSYGPEDAVYYAIVLEDGSIVQQKVMESGYADGEVHVNINSKYAIEVRTGSPPMFVVERYEVESSSSIYVTIDYISPVTDYIDYGLTLNGSGATATVSLYDPDTGSNMYSVSITEGYKSDTISGLIANHTYYFTVANEDETYYSDEVTTTS